MDEEDTDTNIVNNPATPETNPTPAPETNPVDSGANGGNPTPTPADNGATGKDGNNGDTNPTPETNPSNPSPEAKEGDDAKDLEKQVAELTKQLKAMKAEAKAHELEKAANAVADKLGIDKDYIDLLTSKVDVNSCYENEKLDANKLEAAYKAALEKYPKLKKTVDANNGFYQVGGNGQGNKSEGNNKTNSVYSMKPWNRKNYG